FLFFFQAEDGIRDDLVTGVQTCALPISLTVETIARGIERWTPARAPDELVISGGGARNPRLVELLAARVAPRPVVPFDRLFFDEIGRASCRERGEDGVVALAVRGGNRAL